MTPFHRIVPAVLLVVATSLGACQDVSPTATALPTFPVSSCCSQSSIPLDDPTMTVAAEACPVLEFPAWGTSGETPVIFVPEPPPGEVRKAPEALWVHGHRVETADKGVPIEPIPTGSTIEVPSIQGAYCGDGVCSAEENGITCLDDCEGAPGVLCAMRTDDNDPTNGHADTTIYAYYDCEGACREESMGSNAQCSQVYNCREYGFDDGKCISCTSASECDVEAFAQANGYESACMVASCGEDTETCRFHGVTDPQKRCGDQGEGVCWEGACEVFACGNGTCDSFMNGEMVSGQLFHEDAQSCPEDCRP